MHCLLTSSLKWIVSSSSPIVTASNTKPSFSPINTYFEACSSCWRLQLVACQTRLCDFSLLLLQNHNFYRSPRFHWQHHYHSDSSCGFTYSEPTSATSSHSPSTSTSSSFLVQILVIACLDYYNSLLAELPIDLSTASTAHAGSCRLFGFLPL